MRKRSTQSRAVSSLRNATQLRQGDVFLERVAALPATVKPVARDKGRVILAYGEVTGHAHTIDDTETDPIGALYDGTDGDFYLRIESPTGLVHEEHARVELDPGVYKVVRQREYSPEAIRNVAD